MPGALSPLGKRGHATMPGRVFQRHRHQFCSPVTIWLRTLCPRSLKLKTMKTSKQGSRLHSHSKATLTSQTSSSVRCVCACIAWHPCSFWKPALDVQQEHLNHPHAYRYTFRMLAGQAQQAEPVQQDGSMVYSVPSGVAVFLRSHSALPMTAR